MSELPVRILGTISTVSRDGRSAVMTLDEPYQDKRRAVINPDTRGRISLMSKSKDGKLEKDTRVCITATEIGGEALLATEIEAA
jgi:hypothetical protein